MFVNRHGVVTLLAIAAATIVAVGTTAVVGAVFLAPGPTRALIGDAGILVASLGWVGWAVATIVFHERILEWVRHRAALGSGP